MESKALTYDNRALPYISLPSAHYYYCYYYYHYCYNPCSRTADLYCNYNIYLFLLVIPTLYSIIPRTPALLYYISPLPTPSLCTW